MLVKSYQSSEISFQVQTEIAEIRKRVSAFHIHSQVLHIDIKKPVNKMLHFLKNRTLMDAGLQCNGEEKSFCIFDSVYCSYKKIICEYVS